MTQTGFPFTVAGAPLVALPSGALWWAEQRLLAVSDLHLGKSERIARQGGTLLPPYDVQDTLMRLDGAIGAMAPHILICLGDSFDDQASADLDETARDWLARLIAGRRWVWITGNHDPAPVNLGGEHLGAFHIGSLVFRHIADKEARGEVSGHYHPKHRLAGQVRPCFLTDGNRLILPAFGTFTGGLFADDQVFDGLVDRKHARAILTGKTARAVPLGT